MAGEEELDEVMNTTPTSPRKEKKRKKKSRHSSSSLPETSAPIEENAAAAAEAEAEETTVIPKKKKKKRRLDAEEKAAAEAEPVETTIKVEVLSETSDRIAPFVGYFPSGFDPLKKVGRDPEISAFRNKKRSNRLELVVRPKECNVEFVGKSYYGEAAAAQICTYALGVLDKEAQSLKIVPIAANKIFRLEPRMIEKAYIGSELALVEKEEVLARGQKKDRLRELTNLYGSKKNKGMTQKLQALERQRNDAIAQEFVEQQLKDVEVNNEAIEYSSEAVLNIPPHDLTATTPEKAYPLDKIIPKSEWDHLSDFQWIMESGEDLHSAVRFYQEKGYPGFVVSRIHRLTEIQDEKEQKELARVLSYISYLIKFRELSNHRNFLSKLHNSSDTHDIPRVVFQKFVNLFVDPESQAVSSEKKELLVSYILVLTLFVDQFKTTGNDLINDLKMTLASIKPYYKQLGCIFEREVGAFWKGHYTLKVPLKFP